MKKMQRLSYYLKNYKFNSLFVKNLLVIALASLVPLVAATMISYQYFYNISQTEIDQVNQSALESVANVFEVILKESRSNMYRLMENQNVKDFMLYDEQDNPKQQGMVIQNVIREIKTTVISNEIIDSIYVLSEKNSFLISTQQSAGKNDFFDRSWYEDYYQNTKQNMWIASRTVYINNNAIHYISLFQVVRITGQESQGLIVYNFNMRNLTNYLVKGDSIGGLYICTDTGKILLSLNPDEINRSINSVNPELDIGQSMKNGVRKILSHSNYLDGLTYYSIPDLKEYYLKMDQLSLFTGITVAASVIISFLIAFFISVRIFYPIREIMSIVTEPSMWIHMNGITNGSDENELNFIVNNFITTYNKSEKMEKQLIDHLVKLKNAQMIALQSQINPHFLYNTLETIYWMAVKTCNGNNEISKTIKNLSELMRYSLDSKNKLIEAETEIEYVKKYFEIQQIRFGHKIKLVICLDPGILRCKIVKMCLQPVVENAITHGIKPNGGGTIWISGTARENAIEFCVEDDGLGTSREVIDELNKDMGEDYIREEEHIGLRNVNQRIKLIFGEQYGIRIEPGKNCGVKTTIIVPRVEESNS